MTSFSDGLKTGAAQYNRALATAVNSFILGYDNDEISGTPIAPVYVYLLGTASTALASGVFFSASGTGTITATAQTLTSTGALVTAGVATFDVPRHLGFFCTLSATSVTVVLRGTDAYGAPISCSFTGATGGVAYATSGQGVSPVAFKTLLTASITQPQATGFGTTAVSIGTMDIYGLPYRIPNKNRVLAVTMDGAPITATTPATAIGSGILGYFVQAGLATTTAATATTVDVRGSVQFPSQNIADGTRSFAISIVGPSYNVPKSNDTKEITYGVTPFSG